MSILKSLMKSFSSLICTILALSLLFVSYVVRAQSSYSYQSDSIRLTKALHQIDSTYQQNIFYKSEWTDSLYLNGTYESTTLEGLINAILEPYHIYSINLYGNLYLTGDLVLSQNLSFDASNEQPDNRFLFEHLQWMVKPEKLVFYKCPFSRLILCKRFLH